MLIEVAADEEAVVWRSPVLLINEVMAVIIKLRQ
jgi:hypothetical protein